VRCALLTLALHLYKLSLNWTCVMVHAAIEERVSTETSVSHRSTMSSSPSQVWPWQPRRWASQDRRHWRAGVL